MDLKSLDLGRSCMLMRKRALNSIAHILFSFINVVCEILMCFLYS